MWTTTELVIFLVISFIGGFFVTWVMVKEIVWHKYYKEGYEDAKMFSKCNETKQEIEEDFINKIKTKHTWGD